MSIPVKGNDKKSRQDSCLMSPQPRSGVKVFCCDRTYSGQARKGKVSNK